MPKKNYTYKGYVFILIGLAIFVVSEYIIKDLKLLSTASLLIFFFVCVGGSFIIGKDSVIENIYNSISRLIDRILK